MSHSTDNRGYKMSVYMFCNIKDTPHIRALRCHNRLPSARLKSLNKCQPVPSIWIMLTIEFDIVLVECNEREIRDNESQQREYTSTESWWNWTKHLKTWNWHFYTVSRMACECAVWVKSQLLVVERCKDDMDFGNVMNQWIDTHTTHATRSVSRLYWMRW